MTTVHDYYETYWSAEGFNPLRQMPPEVEELLSGLVTTETACLDVGCGDGRTEGAWLHARAGSFIGVDVSSRAIDTAVSLGLDARRIDDASTLPFPDETFDLVACFEVLEHLVFPLDTAREIGRVLKPGGRLVVTVPNVAHWMRRKEFLLGTWNPLGDGEAVGAPWRDPHIRFFSPKTLDAMLRQAGFDDVEIGGHEGRIPLEGKLRLEGWLRPWWTRHLINRHPTLWAQRLQAVATKPTH